MGPLNRRGTLKMGAVALGASSLTGRAQAGPLNTSDPVAVLRAAIKIRATLDGRLTFGALRATRYSLVNAEIRPLMGMITGTFSRYTMNKDGSVGIRSMELAFYTDPVSGELLEKITMPYTNTTVEVPKLRLGPSNLVLTPKWESTEEHTTGGAAGMAPSGTARTVNYLRAPVIRDGKISIQMDAFNKLTPADPKLRPVGYNELVTYTASLADVENESLASAPSHTGFSDISTWRPWMKMDGVEGYTWSSGVGIKAFSVADLPKDYVALAERYYPDVMRDPEKALAG